jgi:hypothetical protein
VVYRQQFRLANIRYQDDLFGLRTADMAGKNHWESFDGNHLGFTTEEFLGWIDKYFGTPVEEASVE